MPTRLKHRRVPLRLHGRRTRGVACAMACSTAVRPEGHAQVYSLSRAEMPSAQAPTTAAAALDDDVGGEADHQGLLQGWPPLEPARTAQAANTQHHRALPRLTARMDQ
jgi:hypothetical protein